MIPERSDPTREPIHLFLDESGTSSADRTLLVGAAAFQNVAAAEALVKESFDRAVGDASLWPDDAKRRKFAETGFHFTEDSESVRQVLLSVLDQLNFRAYVAYATNDDAESLSDRLIAMYGTLLSSVLVRYREHALTVVFEENSVMDGVYGSLWEVLRQDASLPEATAYRGSKSAPCLAVIDYVLGITRVKLAGHAADFQTIRYIALGKHLAYLIDFDDDRHLGGRRHPIV